MGLCDLGDIKEILGRHGFRFSKALGQNFLIAPWVPERMAEESGLSEKNGVLEIGPGIGCLTTQLCEIAGRVAAVELDSRLIPVLEETLSGYNNVEVIPGDIMKADISALVSSRFEGLEPAVCANLPYNITSPVITRLMESGLVSSLTLMVQKEVADRLCAEAGTPEYGALTVFVNYYAEARTLFKVPSGCFYPQPKVDSAVVSLKMRTPPRPEKDRELFFRTVRASFSMRRKTLVNGLFSAFGNDFSKEELQAILASLGHSPTIRGETLDVDGFAALAARLKK